MVLCGGVALIESACLAVRWSPVVAQIVAQIVALFLLAQAPLIFIYYIILAWIIPGIGRAWCRYNM